MRYSLLAVPLLAALAYAQLPGLPSCAQNAATQGIADSGCGGTDVQCLCSKALSNPSLQSSIKSACSPADVCQTIKFAQSICPGQTIPGADQCASSSGGSSSAASSSAASSSAATNSTAAAGGASATSSGMSLMNSSSGTNTGSSSMASMTSGASTTSSPTGSATAGGQSSTQASSSAAPASTAAAGRMEVKGLGLAVLGFGAALVV